MGLFKSFEDAVVSDIEKIIERIETVASEGVKDVETFLHAKKVLIESRINSLEDHVKGLVKLGIADVTEVEQEVKDHIIALENYFTKVGKSVQGVVDSVEGK